ncbi:GLUG motif-containing protein [Natronosalvus amylolyticus]|uniref:GLUG motif-containing protein n=1 Tax=Natronosalvus amylolyticus TaxID=2961994 RepID=UPI0020C9C960|nr:GLUG motif-containing protein [Natronosalvus amylolyticus]
MSLPKGNDTDSSPRETRNRHFSRRATLSTIGVGLTGLFVGVSRLTRADTSGGDGSEDNPYEIETWADLDSVRSDPDSAFVLTTTLDSDTVDYDEYASETANDGEGWDPISDFSGTLDGSGHEIADMVIERTDAGNEFDIGVFGSADGEIKNLGVTDADIDATVDVGALVGRSSGDIVNCYASGTIEIDTADSRQFDSERVGGLVGQNDGTISDSYSSMSVNCGHHVGGLVGRNTGTITRSYADGFSVSGGGSSIGGLVGTNTGEITYAYSDVYSTGDRANTRDWASGFGGLVGVNTDLGLIEKSFALSPAFRNTNNDDVYVGALVGENTGDAEIKQAYSAGQADDFPFDGGGVAGLNTSSIVNVYYNAWSNDQGIGDEDGGSSTVYGVDQPDMQGASAEFEMVELDFTETWATVLAPDGDYPILQVFDTRPDPIGPFEKPPNDLNGDGLFEDINGDGRATVVDVQAMHQHLDDEVFTAHSEKFNFSGGDPDDVTQADVEALYALVTGGRVK